MINRIELNMIDQVLDVWCFNHCIPARLQQDLESFHYAIQICGVSKYIIRVDHIR